jgi:hypothetical protein
MEDKAKGRMKEAEGRDQLREDQAASETPSRAARAPTNLHRQASYASDLGVRVSEGNEQNQQDQQGGEAQAAVGQVTDQASAGCRRRCARPGQRDPGPSPLTPA